MQSFDPTNLAEWTHGTWHEASQPNTISGFCFDARQLQPGECFVALSGGARDGHDFVQQAVELGASSVLVEQVQDTKAPQLIVKDSLLAMGAIARAVRHGFSKPVVGITGSCGKTSTKEMLRALLGESSTHATAGNWNNRIGVPMTLFGLDAAHHEFAVIEAGINQPREMIELGRMIQPDLTIITNVASAHLELLGSIENVANEKAQLAEQAVPGSSVILPVDVMRYAAFQKMSNRAIVLVEEGEAFTAAAKRVVHYSITGEGASLKLTLKDGSLQTDYLISSASRGIVTNAALAILAARELGIEEIAIKVRIEAWAPTSSRGQIVTHGTRTFYVDCYNANPASMADSLVAFCRSIPTSTARCYVLGAMNELGSDAAQLHQQVGKLLNLRSEDRAILVGPVDLTHAYAGGARAAGAADSQLLEAENVENIKSSIADFEGALFLKGSRAYALEKLLPEGDDGSAGLHT